MVRLTVSITGADTVAPSIPTGLIASAVSCSQVNLSWSGSTDTGGSGLAGYKVYRNGVQIATTASTSYINIGLTASTTYSYRIAAYDNAGNTSAQSLAASVTTPSCGDITPPSIPTGLTASAVSCSQVNLSWSGSTDTGGSGLAGYKVYRNGVQIATTPSTSFINSGLVASTAYSYRIAAYDNAGNNSAQSVAASVTTPACSNQPPVANAGPDQTAATATALTFDGSGSSDPDGTISSYTWSFGDGASANGRTVTHAYSAAGTYVATLTVVDNSGASDTDSASVTVTSVGGPGQLVWSKGFGGTGTDLGQAVAVDGSDNILVTGYFTGTASLGGGTLTGAGGIDIFVAKYSSASSGGTHLWSKRIGSAGSDSGQSIAVDPSGNVIVTGYFQGTVDFGGGPLTSAGMDDIFVVQYSPAGAYRWSRRIGGTSNDHGQSVAVDFRGDVVVTGYFQNTVDFGSGVSTSAITGPDVFVAKYSASSGAHLWSRSFPNSSDDIGTGIAVNGSGDVMLTGYFIGAVDLGGGILRTVGNNDIFVAKFSGANGSHLWSKAMGGSGNDRGQAIAVDSSGNVVVTGYFVGALDFGGGSLAGGTLGFSDTFVAKYSGATGTHMWSKHFGTTSYADEGKGIAVDISGNVMVTGYFQGSVSLGGGSLISAGGNDIIVAKYSGTTGAYLWSRRFGSSLSETGSGVAVDGNGYAAATGYFGGAAGFGGGTLISAGSADIFLITFWP